MLGNHDRPRLASRVGAGQARVAAMLLLTLRGTPTLYYGDEIGMRDVPVPPERVQDPWERTCRASASAATRAHADAVGRRPERGLLRAGGEPWLPLADDAARSTSPPSATTRARC